MTPSRLAGLALSLASASCAPPTVLRPVAGLELRSSWCDPGRGAPPAPELGMTRPVRIGVGSIVHAKDGTTESFLAHEAWVSEPFVPERSTEVVLVDHPTDADYAISGSVTGEVSYERKVHTPSKGVQALQLTSLFAFSFGLSAAILGTTLSATGEDVGEPILTGGLLGMSTLPATLIYNATRPANQYAWTHEARLVLRRHGVRIGEVVVRDDDRTSRREPIDGYRRHTLARLWRKAREQLGQCIAADLAQVPVDGPVAHQEASP